MKKKTDYIGMWFKVRKELGISDEMNVAQWDLVNDTINWETYPHSEMDGLGGMAYAMRKAGYPTVELPRSAEKKKLSFLHFIKLMIKKKKSNIPKKIRWKHHANIDSTCQGEIKYCYLSEDETLLVKKNARQLKVTLNHFVFWALNKAIAQHLLADKQSYYWLYPINLRGPLDFGTDYFNYSSSIDVLVTNDSEPLAIHDQVKQQIKAKTHWINWYLGNIGKLIGTAGIRYIYKKYSKKNYLAGSFSFLGQWPLKPDRKNEDKNKSIWVSCGIGTRNYPISTGIILWYDRLSLGIKLHPSICQDPLMTQRCLDTWKRLMIAPGS